MKHNDFKCFIEQVCNSQLFTTQSLWQPSLLHLPLQPSQELVHFTEKRQNDKYWNRRATNSILYSEITTSLLLPLMDHRPCQEDLLCLLP